VQLLSASLLPLPLHAGGGWVGVLLIFGRRATPPQPSPASRGGSTSAAQGVSRALAGAWLRPCSCLAPALASLLLWLRSCSGFAPALASLLLWLGSCSGLAPALASLLLWLCFCSALLLIQLLHIVRAGRAPLYPGPLCGGEVRTTGPARGNRHGCRFLFASTRMCCRKARPHLTRFLGRMPRKRCAGCLFLLVTSLLDKQKRSNSPSAGGRNALKL